MHAVTGLSTLVTEMSTRQNDDLCATLFGRTRRAVLAALYGHPGEAMYLRELARTTGMGLGAVQREVKKLSDAGVIRRSTRGRQVYYEADPDCPIFPELRGLVAKTAGMADVLRSALSPLAAGLGAAFVYGSMASGEAGPGSDVDLMAIGDVDELDLHDAVTRAEEALGRSVNYTLLSRVEFQRRRKEKGGFVSRVLRGPKIAIQGDVHELR